MFCFFSPSNCVELLQLCGEQKVETSDNRENESKLKMHSSESAGGRGGPLLLEQLARMVIRARGSSPTAPGKLPSTSQVQVQPLPRSDEDEAAALEEELSAHVRALWTDMEPLCIEVAAAPGCSVCERARRPALLLERWTMRPLAHKSDDAPLFINSQWLVNAVRSQLHFSQLSAWLATLNDHGSRRKLSREQCNIKKIEANCDDDPNPRKLKIVYSIKTPDKIADFTRQPTEHTFPLTDIGDKYLKITLQSLPRIDMPTLKCLCQKRRHSKDMHDDLVGRLNDLSLGSINGAINSNIGTPTRRLSIISNQEYYNEKEKDLVDDRMLTPCSENGKHKCCDDESDGKEKEKQPAKRLDERRLKEIAKYKRRVRKEKMKQLCESSSSEDGKIKETTSIPILQASRFDRLRAIGCYRMQTYLTLPASRMETKSPFIDAEVAAPEYRRTNTVGTQTDELVCACGNFVELKCDSCVQGMVRSEGNYNLASLTDNAEDKHEIGARRKLDDVTDGKAMKKLKCDNSIKCDSLSNYRDFIKRPKLRRAPPIMERIDKIATDRHKVDTERDMIDLHLNTDDTVFSVPKESKRQKTYSIGDDGFVLYEKCDYGTFDRHELESPKEDIPPPDFKFSVPRKEDVDEDVESLRDGFIFPHPKRGDGVPSPSEMERFRWRFDSAASMVFHTKTGLPLTSSPAPLRRGNNCFDFDDSINGISGIKSALFHPISPQSPLVPASPSPPPRPKRENKLRIPPSTGLLGSFEESALQGRLEAAATVHGFTAELGASGALCPPHLRLPVTVFFYAPGGTNAPYMGHINLGPHGYRVSRSGTIQVSLFNPHGTLVKMFVVLYDLSCMPPMARTFLRQRTLYLPAGADPPVGHTHRYLRYLIHLRFMTSKSGKLYLHTDIRLIVSRKADLDTATAHSALFRPIPTKNEDKNDSSKDKNVNDLSTNGASVNEASINCSSVNDSSVNEASINDSSAKSRAPNRVFGGSSEFDSELFDNPNGVSYELRSFTYAPENPKYSPC